MSVSLATGLIGNLELMTWHLRCGFVVLGLLAFRLVWALVGTRHARFAAYRTSASALARYLRGRAAAGAPGASLAAHTPPGILMAWLVWLACLIQGVAGLYTTDDIFTEGPLVRHASADVVDAAGFVHARLYWAILALVVAHVTAIIWYGAVRGDPLWMSMFTGRKMAAVEPVGDRPLAAAGAWLIAILIIVWLARL